VNLVSGANVTVKREGNNVVLITISINVENKVKDDIGKLLDACLVAVGSAMVSWLDDVSDGWGGIVFPNQYVIRNAVVGEGAVNVSDSRLTCVVRLRCDVPSTDTCCGERVNSLVNALVSSLHDVLEGRLVRHVMNYGRKLVNVGEDVEVTLRGGGIVKGEVIGYGTGGELIVATRTGLAKVKPSKVARIKRLWP